MSLALRAGTLSPHSTSLDDITTSTLRNFSNSNSTNHNLGGRPNPANDKPYKKYRVYLAVGSNMGDRYAHIHRALQLLTNSSSNNNPISPEELGTATRHNKSHTRLIRTSFLHETAPMYVTDQPAFLNGVVCIETDLEPLALLRRLKEIEQELGRDTMTIRNGPRTVDLDVLLYFHKEDHDDDNQQELKDVILNDDPILILPHPRIPEREFVLQPLLEVAGPHLRLPYANHSLTVGQALQSLRQQTQESNSTNASAAAVRVLPLPRGRFLYWNETVIMGILNVTPDSFSDGGQFQDSVETAVARAQTLIAQGATILDVGGESTRPGAVEVSVTEELERTIPVLQAVRRIDPDIILSIDTRHAAVARAAVEAGADMVNDVSGGTHDPDMAGTVAELGVPWILMHMRGTPATMSSLTEYPDVVGHVATALMERSEWAAREYGIHRWRQVIDPGIGFAKDLRGNLLLLRNLGEIRSQAQGLPILIGTSRKGFIGKITGVTDPQARDPGTIASFVASLCLEQQQQTQQQEPEWDWDPSASSAYHRCNIVRVHNVEHCKQAAMVMDAMQNVK